MTGKEFLNSVANGKVDLLGLLLEALAQAEADYCVIGGLAVNAYAEPVVSLDLDLVVISERLPALRAAAEAAGMTSKDFEHSVKLFMAGSDLRIQLQTDPRYQEFIPRAELHEVLGYRMSVASLEDLLAGKVWAYSDETRRGSKRQKDLADIMRLVENHPRLIALLPPAVRALLD
jgi:hypothetical protein